MYKNKDLSPEVRAKDLLSKMTLDEKIAQMNMQKLAGELNDIIMSEDQDNTKEYTPYGGTLFEKYGGVVDKIQDFYLKKTRLGIPFLHVGEGLHGLLHKGCTKFPQCMGIAGSFDREKVRKMAEIIGMESRAFGVRQLYAPCVDISHDPRWGRTQESYGEDPYLSGELGAQYVKGVQSHGVAATAKHYIAYGLGENGLNISPAHIGEREVREVMLEPFKKCIDAGAMAIMPSYNEVDGVPIHGSKKYLRDILRGELGFTGVTCSDFSGVEMMHRIQRIAKHSITAGKRAIEAGLDMEAPYPFGYNEVFKQAVIDGEIDQELVDEAVLRILTVKFKLGLFEDPYTVPELIEKVHNKEFIDFSRELEEDSILLLKNDGILPLDEKSVGKVAVIGNNAKRSSLGDYMAWDDYCVSFYDGIKNRLGEENVLYARGCNPLTCTDSMISKAVETAKQADTVFLVIGDCNSKGGGIPGLEEEAMFETTVGEGYDVNSLDLPVSQKRLFDEIMALNKPTVLVFYGGRPYAIEQEVEKVNAFMFSWGGGEQSGNAFANLIFGDKSPSAKLAISFPNSIGSIPCHYNHKVSAKGYYKKPGTFENPGRDYVFGTPEAWMPFGYGLSYTNVEYSDLSAVVQKDGSVKVWVTVENKGDYDINESVLLFVKALWCEITPFVKRLRNFSKVELKPGDKKTVEFLLTDEDFTYIDFDYKTAVNHGEHKILVQNLECDIII